MEGISYETQAIRKVSICQFYEHEGKVDTKEFEDASGVMICVAYFNKIDA